MWSAEAPESPKDTVPESGAINNGGCFASTAVSSGYPTGMKYAWLFITGGMAAERIGVCHEQEEARGISETAP
jgi:hypothetical protein